MSAAVEALWDRAAELELELRTFEAELEVFHGEYLRRVGGVIADYHAAVVRLMEATGDVRGFESASERARQSAADLAAVPPPPGPPPTEDLKTLFRSAAKRMHPDLVGEAGRPHAEAFMKRLNAAYKAGDGGAMADLLRQWESSPFAAPSTGGPAEVAAAQAAVTAAEQRLADAHASDVARLMEATIAAEFRGEDHLAVLAAQWRTALDDVRSQLAALTTPG